MTRLIDADALIDAIDQWIPSQEEFMESAIPPIENLAVSVLLTIEAQPTVDAKPVKHGKWEEIRPYDVRCSICGNSMMDKYPFCPECGARMEE